MPTQTISIMMVEDHQSLLDSFSRYLKTLPHIRWLGGVNNGAELFELLPGLNPDVILLDLELPIMNGFTALTILRKEYPHIKVIVLSGKANPSLYKRLSDLGAHAYLTKHSGMDELVLSIHRVMEDAATKSASSTKENPEDEEKLSVGELRVLKLYCRGLLHKEIAHSLTISINTVKYYLKRIYKKTGLNNSRDLVKYAIKQGYADLE